MSKRESQSSIQSDDLPITVHTTVLGVDIVAHQGPMWAEVHEGGHTGGLKPDIEIETWDGSNRRLKAQLKPDIGAWARRNLFCGARTGTDQ